MAGKASKKSAKGAEASEGLSASARIDGAIAGLGDWRGERSAEIRRLIHEADAEVVEEWKWMGSPVFSHDGIFVVANTHKVKVKLTFAHGAQLADRAFGVDHGVGCRTTSTSSPRMTERNSDKQTYHSALLKLN